MNLDFWAARWGQHRIGFHLQDVNPKLLIHGPRWLDFSSWDEARPLANQKILVPLCGKALDLRWLAERGAEVTGVEFVEQAAVSFFAEQQLEFAQQPWRLGKALVSTDPGFKVRIVVADFFALKADELGHFDAIYDRAALVAVDPQRRAEYANQVARLCPIGARLLLMTFEHDTGNGPPFTVPQDEVSALFGETFSPALLEDSDLLLTEPQFRARGASYCREQVWIGRRI
jgi:thiopurine S-methyltransferase